MFGAKKITCWPPVADPCPIQCESTQCKRRLILYEPTAYNASLTCIYPCTTPGMLLEQHKEAVLHLLSEPSLLEEQVNLALKTLQE